MVSGSGWVTTQVAAAALKVAPRTVRDYIKSGKLTGRTEGQGVQKTWYVSIDSLHALRASRRGENPGGVGVPQNQAHNRREAEELTEEIAAELRGGPAADPAADHGEGQRHATAETPGRDRDDILRDAILRLETRGAENAELRAPASNSPSRPKAPPERPWSVKQRRSSANASVPTASNRRSPG